MTSIKFQSRTNAATVSGSERYLMASRVGAFAVAAADLPAFPTETDRAWLGAFLGDPRATAPTPVLVDRVRTAIHVASGAVLGHDLFTVTLNTAVREGGDALRLCARIHGQCEVHAWVDGPDRAWLADQIAWAVLRNVLRPGMGWEAVTELLREADDRPVVTSYSVTENFPYAILDRDPGDEDPDPDDVWNRGVAALRAEPGSFTRRMHPGNWHRYHFGPGVTMYDLTAELRRTTST